MEPKHCQNCSEIFTPKKKRQIYCCISCQCTHSWKTGKLKGRKRKGLTLSCEYCKNEFYVPEYRLATAKFCSRRCTSLANPDNTKKAMEKSPLMKRARAMAGQVKNKIYKTITVDGKSVREHRWLMEQHLGRKLESWEQVHHIDGNHLNNDISNLEVLSNADHQRKELEAWREET